MSSSEAVLPNARTVLGLDLARNTGYSLITICSEELDVSVGSFSVPKKEADSGIQAGAITGKFLKSYIESLPEKKVDVLVYEGYGFSPGNAVFTIEFSSIVKYFLRDMAGTTILVAPTSLKKYVTGKGNIKKSMMPLEVYKRFGIEVDNDDESDAVALAHFGVQWATDMKLVPKSHTPGLLPANVIHYS